ncbi:unnamed protein product [Cyprideis torosa]|uniref:Large ribosomal subunit protein uL18c n=1 Tax=Cyprideis torosa TaxID=163714 RepID=A0A7R8WY51_9CRUS|nr:unnamed protein product [Cyprideis torosa]CAG0909597.1 unnamed protein product [Cyprideis torosa]
MSRIGKSPISIPSGVDIDYNKEKSIVTIKGTKGTLVQPIDKDIELKIEDGTLTLARPTEQKRHKALHGLYRSLINNMIEGVSNGYKKKLELVGVGYRATVSGQILEMALGFSHPVVMQIPNEIKVSADMPKGVPPFIILESFDKQLLEMPRLSIFRSNKQIYAQLIDDVNGNTIASTSSVEIKETGNKCEVSKLVGKSLAEKASVKGIENVVFDRSGYLYHGRIKSLAEGARENGLKF